MNRAVAVMFVILLGSGIGLAMADLNKAALYALTVAGCIGLLGLLFGSDKED